MEERLARQKNILVEFGHIFFLKGTLGDKIVIIQIKQKLTGKIPIFTF